MELSPSSRLPSGERVGGVEDHGVSEALQLRHQPAGVRVGVTLVEPVGTDLAVGLVALEASGWKI